MTLAEYDRSGAERSGDALRGVPGRGWTLESLAGDPCHQPWVHHRLVCSPTPWAITAASPRAEGRQNLLLNQRDLEWTERFFHRRQGILDRLHRAVRSRGAALHLHPGGDRANIALPALYPRNPDRGDNLELFLLFCGWKLRDDWSVVQKIFSSGRYRDCAPYHHWSHLVLANAASKSRSRLFPIPILEQLCDRIAEPRQKAFPFKVACGANQFAVHG